MSLQSSEGAINIAPVKLLDTWRVGQILCRALSAARDTGPSALEKWFNCTLLPLALPFVRYGYRAARGGRILGCAYVDWRSRSGYVFNVAVDARFRRQGVATALMRFLEQQTGRHGIEWLGLYVDRDNLAARRLYQEAGYHAHAAQIMRRSDPGRLPEPAVRVGLNSLSYRRGRRLMNVYRKEEFRADGEWAGRVVEQDYSPALPAGGRFWQISQADSAIGVACCRQGQEERTVIHLWLAPGWWGDQNVLLGVIHALARGRQVDIDVTSDEHLQALQQVLIPLGFAPLFRSQLLMLKKTEATR